MRLLTVLAVKVLFQDELAVAGNEYAVDLGRPDGVHCRVDQFLDELRDRRAIDPDRLQRTRGPAVVPAWRR